MLADSNQNSPWQWMQSWCAKDIIKLLHEVRIKCKRPRFAIKYRERTLVLKYRFYRILIFNEAPCPVPNFRVRMRNTNVELQMLSIINRKTSIEIMAMGAPRVASFGASAYGQNVKSVSDWRH